MSNSTVTSRRPSSSPVVLRTNTPGTVLSLSLQLPVWSDLDPAALESDWNLLAEIRYAF